MGNFLITNGIDTLDFGVTALKLPPVGTAKKRVDTHEIAGRSGALHTSLGDYEEIKKELTLMYVGDNPAQAAGLLSSATKFVFSNEPEFEYTGYVSDEFDMPNTAKGLYEFKYPLICNPLKAESNPQEIILISGMSIANETNEPDYPTFVIAGAGTVVLTVGSQTVTLTGVTTPITIDGDMLTCYDTANASNRMSLSPVSDVGFPVILPGEEVIISWSGSVSSVVMRPNWRWH